MNSQDDEKRTENQPPPLDTPEENDKETPPEDPEAERDQDDDLDPENDIDEDDDWENRKLCSDGNCIGVIGSDGRCKECGKPHEASEEDEFSEDEAETGQSEDYPSEQPYDLEEEEEEEEEDEDDFEKVDIDDWANRKLCSDGNCIGVIGPNGRCKECGKPYKG